MEFSEKLQQLRNKKGMTQEQLAEKVFVSRVAVSKWEAGRGYPNIDSLKKIAEVFGVTVDDLLSAGELIDVAQNQSREKGFVLRDLFFGIIDFMVALMFVIPMFANRFEDYIDIVTIFNLTEEPTYVRIPVLVMISIVSVFGVVELALQNIQNRRKQIVVLVLSGMCSSIGVVFSAMINQPDSCIFFFVLFLVKVIVALKISK